jgi:hypothetical protein
MVTKCGPAVASKRVLSFGSEHSCQLGLKYQYISHAVIFTRFLAVVLSRIGGATIRKHGYAPIACKRCKANGKNAAGSKTNT